jgi:hypothetical protein
VGRVVPLLIPAAELAVATHPGSLRDIDVTYGQLGSYVTTQEISVDGPLREYYLVDAHDTPDEKPSGEPRSPGPSSAPTDPRHDYGQTFGRIVPQSLPIAPDSGTGTGTAR